MTAGCQFRTLPNTLYAIPKAHLLYKPQGQEDFLLLGDTDEIVIEPTVEEVERYSNECGTRQLELSVVTQIDASISFSLAQLTDINRALSMLGESTSNTQTLQAGLTKSRTAPPHNGEIIKLDGFNVDNVVVEDGAQLVTYTIDVDYKLDSAGGMVQLINIPVGADGDVLITYDATEVLAADGYKKWGIGEKSENRGTLIIRQTNEVGPRSMVTLHDVQLRPDGERNFVSDEEFDILEIVGRAFRDETQLPGFEIGIEQTLS